MSVGSALSAGVSAPLRRWRLVLLLWLARLAPIVLVFGLPTFERVRERSAHHPDAVMLVDRSADTAGFAWAWTSDIFRDTMSDTSDTVFWLIIFCWLSVTVLAGGITARLVHGRASGLFLAECGRYAGRFLKLGIITLLCVYAVDVLFNVFLHESHRKGALLHHSQQYYLEKTWMRGLLFVAIAYLIGLVSSYARIDIVANSRRSALIAFLRGIGTLLLRLPRLLVVETGMLAAIGAAAGLAWFLTRVAAPAGSAPIAVFLLLAALTSYLRTGVEIGALEARCRLLVGGETPESGPLPALVEGDPGDLFLPPENAG